MLVVLGSIPSPIRSSSNSGERRRNTSTSSSGAASIDATTFTCPQVKRGY